MSRTASEKIIDPKELPEDLSGSYDSQTIAANHKMFTDILADDLAHHSDAFRDELQRMKHHLENAFEFKMNHIVALMLARTEPDKNILKDMKLPYDTMYLEGAFGIKDEKKISLIPNFIAYTAMDGIHVAFMQVNACGVKRDVAMADYSFNEVGADEVKNFLLNFLALLQTKEVVLKERRSFSSEQRKKRLNRGKVGAGYVEIILGEKLQRYVDTLTTEHKNIMSAHWVMGHWMHFIAPRYKDARGTRTWVYPFIRGRGTVNKKPYMVKMK